MLLLILEIVMFATGLYALVTGKLPQVISGKKFRVEGAGARIIGAVCAAPLPLAFIIGFILGFAMGDSGVLIAGVTEWVLVVAAAIAASVMSRRMGQQIA